MARSSASAGICTLAPAPGGDRHKACRMSALTGERSAWKSPITTRPLTPSASISGRRSAAVFSNTGVDLLLAVGQCQPGLQAGDRHRRAAQFLRRALGMDDAAAGRHQIHVARLDDHFGAERIAVPDLAVEQIGDGGKPDMRMRTHIHRLAGAQDGRTHAVEEDEGADQPALCRRQSAANLEAADVLGVRDHHQLDLRRWRRRRRARDRLPGKKLIWS